MNRRGLVIILALALSFPVAAAEKQSEQSLGRQQQTYTPSLAVSGCACGAIHYECSADPVRMLNCHCRDCQQASGSAYAAIVVVPKAAVQIRGEPRYHKVVGKAGKAVERGFCPNC